MKQKIASGLISLSVIASSLAFASPAFAVNPEYNLQGQSFTVNFTCVTGCAGTYPHQMNVTTQNAAGDFSGTGYYIADPTYTWNVTGNITENKIDYTLDYTGQQPNYQLDAQGTITPNGAMSGTATDNLSRTFTWDATAGSAQPLFSTAIPSECDQNANWNIIQGTNGNDTLNGTSSRDLIFGYGGNDTIKGTSGDDCLVGGSGNDNVQGGSGDDVILGRGGNDSNLQGNTGDDKIYGGAGNDTLKGDSGNDELRGQGGASDSADGSSGTDTCDAEVESASCEL
jgi:Ca2+-binding RTX toxin-like protein